MSFCSICLIAVKLRAQKASLKERFAAGTMFFTHFPVFRRNINSINSNEKLAQYLQIKLHHIWPKINPSKQMSRKSINEISNKLVSFDKLQ